MSKQNTTTAKGGARSKPRPSRARLDNSNAALARHLAEAIRIVRARPDLPVSFYNDLAEAVNDFENVLPNGGVYQESEPHLLLMLDYYAEQTGKGGRR